MEYSVTSDKLDYEVVQEASSGFFGFFGGKDAIIKARVRTEQEFAAEAAAIEKAEKKDALLTQAPGTLPKEKKVERKDNRRPEKKAEKKQDKKPEKKFEKKPEKKAEKKAEVKAEVKIEDKTEAEIKVKSAPKQEEISASEEKNSAGRFVSADEIEKRAAAAAAKAEAEGYTNQEERPEKKKNSRRDGRNNRRDRGRKNDKRDDRRKKSAQTFVTVEEKPHKPSQPKPEREVLPKSEEEVAEIMNLARTFLEDVFRCMDTKVEITMEYNQKEGCLGCTFAGEEMGILIGKRGQTLDSLQYLTSLVINKNKSDYTRVKLDTEDYRARRADTLENLSRNIAYKVKRSRKAVALEPMNPYERRIIHSALQNNKFVETYSEGEEPYRHVVVAPKRS
ncbi:MAG: KH domain-containing protein [Oscillospiraceae bacterium]|nr:KH domain-containing protein [Oscillospiraceae bacterium]